MILVLSKKNLIATGQKRKQIRLENNFIVDKKMVRCPHLIIKAKHDT